MGFDFKFVLEMEDAAFWTGAAVSGERSTVDTITTVPFRMIAPLKLRWLLLPRRSATMWMNFIESSAHLYSHQLLPHRSERGQRLLRIRGVPPDSSPDVGRNDARGVVAAESGDVASGMR